MSNAENKENTPNALEALRSSKVELAQIDDGVKLVKEAALASKFKDAAAFADDFIEKLDEASYKTLLRSMVMHTAERENKKISDTVGMNELSKDFGKGTYPYKNPYSKALYQKEIFLLQVELLKLQKWIKEQGKKLVIVFEGRDAAGKGGTIKRFTENLNPRGARIVALPKPNETELGQWFFQRYVAQLPTAGEIVFFDRSWYNRAVVEPVMGFCNEHQYERFMREVPAFEKALVESDIQLFKFWLDVGQEEQKRRFKSRANHPLKRWKLSPVDIESLKKWDNYTQHIGAMFDRTDMPFAPWTVIRSDDKMRARLNAIRVVLLSVDYEGKDVEAIGEIDPLIVSRPIHCAKGSAISSQAGKLPVDTHNTEEKKVKSEKAKKNA